MGSEILRHRHGKELVAAAHPSFVLLVWVDAPTLEAVAKLGEILRPYEERGEQADLVVVILKESRYPSDEARRQLAEGMRSPAIRRIALVSEGKGFRASIVRSILSGISLMTRKSIEQRVCTSVDEAEAWLLERTRDYGPGEILHAYQSLRDEALARGGG